MTPRGSQALDVERLRAWLCGRHGLDPGLAEEVRVGRALIFGSALLTLLVPGHEWQPCPVLDLFVEEGEQALMKKCGFGEEELQESLALRGSSHDAFLREIVARRRVRGVVLWIVRRGALHTVREAAAVGGDVYVAGGRLCWSRPEALGALALLNVRCLSCYEGSSAAEHAKQRGLRLFRVESGSGAWREREFPGAIEAGAAREI